QIPWMFAFLTRELGLDPNRLYVTCFRGNETLQIPRDEESAQLWQQQFAAMGIEATIVDFPERDGLQGGRIFYYDEKKNWWSRTGVPAAMPVGEPGGPDSEMFWDFGAQAHLHEQSVWKDQPCHVNCDCGRFMEIGNNVFMEYVKTEQGFQKLPQKNVDFGGGLERLAAAVLDNPDVFQIDLFTPVLKAIEELSEKPYAGNHKAFRVIADHIRAVTFLIADGVIPSNKDQGYFARRLIRRAVRFGHELGLTQPFCAEIARHVVAVYADAYPELSKARDTIDTEITKEENRFRQTLATGLRLLTQLLASDAV